LSKRFLPAKISGWWLRSLNFLQFRYRLNGGMVCTADANFAAHASLQRDVRGTGVAQDPQCETGTTDCVADQIQRVNICKAARSFEVEL